MSFINHSYNFYILILCILCDYVMNVSLLLEYVTQGGRAMLVLVQLCHPSPLLVKQ